MQSSVGWITSEWNQTQCNNPPLGQLTTCTTPYLVAANTTSTRSGSLYVSFGSSGEDGPITITQFGPPETLTVGVTGSGKVTSSPAGISCPGTCSVGVYYGNTITLSASPSTGYTFSGWSGACSGTGGCSLTMYSPQSVSATFTAIPETLTVGVTGSGTVLSSPGGISCPGICGTTFSYGTSVILTASPSSGFVFSGWSGACSGTAQTCTVTMTAAKSVTATFATTATLSVGLSGSGTVTSSPSGISCPNNCSAGFAIGTVVTLTTSPAAGYGFAGWSGACSGKGSCAVTMSASESVTASFDQLLINTFAGGGSGGYPDDGVTATSAELSYPASVAVDTNGNVYIADEAGDRIRKVTKSTGIISTIAGNGTQGYSGDGGAATSAELSLPDGVAVDTSGNVYIADFGNKRIRKVTTAGIISTVAGNGTAGYSGDGGAATSAEISAPGGVAVDTSGNIYIADQSNNRIRKVTSAGIISTVAGNGTAGFSGDGGAATNAEIQTPMGVAVDAAGNVYISDTYNARVRKVTSGGTISTVAGNGTFGESGDGGAAINAEFYYSHQIAVDSAGNLYITDPGIHSTVNNRVRRVNAAGIISTVAGTGTVGFSGDGGPASSAKLSGPYGVAVGLDGAIYIGDSGNERVRIVGP